MDIVTALLSLLVLHALLGAFDTFVSHEWRERLPAHAWASTELAVHSARSALFVMIFAGLAWFEWHGAFGWLIVAVMLAEYAITIVDSIVEDRTRRLSATERTNHMLLALNTGAYATLLTLLVATDWQHAPAAVVAARHPPLLVALLTLSAIAVAAWAVRDGLASFRLRSGAGDARSASASRQAPLRVPARSRYGGSHD